jgi:two-component system phosphate regulon sensor histidine kinase PhoR
VERVLQMATLEKEDLGLKKEKVDVHEIINKAISSLEVPLADRNGVVEKELYAQPSEIIADPLHLTNIIYNLIDNSIKYCNENPKIIVSTKNEKGKFVIEVGDNGIGITPEHQKKVFHKFFRVPTGNIHDVKGFGLGLNYVRIMVKAHEGEIKLQSEVNKGTRFKLSFPLA